MAAVQPRAAVPFPLPPGFPPTDTLFYPPAAGEAESACVLFLPGNPGLVGYYPPFLSHLSALHPSLSVLGTSHAGFTPPGEPGRYYSLHDEVENKLELLRWLEVYGDRSNSTEETVRLGRRKIILMAHSMGCWLAMEVMRILSEQTEREVDVIGAVLLFPTVVDIAKSRSGRTLGPLLGSSLVQKTLTGFASLLAALPASVVTRLVQLVTGHPQDMAATTVKMLQHPAVLSQTLKLAAEEMKTITSDRWDDEVWGAGSAGVRPDSQTQSSSSSEGGAESEGWVDVAKGAESSGAAAGNQRKLVFYFGRHDHWVAEETREEILKLRGGGAHMQVCEESMPHSFCIHHSERMAEKVAIWVKDMTGP